MLKVLPDAEPMTNEQAMEYAQEAADKARAQLNTACGLLINHYIKPPKFRFQLSADSAAELKLEGNVDPEALEVLSVMVRLAAKTWKGGGPSKPVRQVVQEMLDSWDEDGGRTVDPPA